MLFRSLTSLVWVTSIVSLLLTFIVSKALIGDIAIKLGRSPAQVVLAWHIKLGLIVIPKSVRPERMAQNIDIFDFELSADELARIAALDTGASQFFDHRDPAMVHALGTRKLS